MFFVLFVCVLSIAADIVFDYRQKVTRSFEYLQGDYYIAPLFLVISALLSFFFFIFFFGACLSLVAIFPICCCCSSLVKFWFNLFSANENY